LGVSQALFLSSLLSDASSGIGEALAKELASRGYRMTLASEDGPELERVRREITAGFPVEAQTLIEDLTAAGTAERLLALHVQVPTGFILNVGSISSLFPDPASHAYGPSKRYLLAFSRSLRLSWRERGVRVCCQVSGGVRTAFFAHNEVYVPGMVTGHLYPADKCAGKALDALFRGRGRITPGLEAHLEVMLFRAPLSPALNGLFKRLYFRLKSGRQSA
jgi:short-subunit dehydrogenase